jgi:tetratricopeptide (TPR) repeat protein
MKTFQKNQIRRVLISLLFCLPVGLWAATSQDLRQMGQALNQKGLYSKALAYFQQAVQADPNDWQSYEGMGDAYMDMNDNVQALSAYQKSLRINPNNPTVQTQVQNLGGSPAVQDQNNYNSLSQDHPNINNQVQRPTRPVYTDGLAPMDHAKFWGSLQIGYSYSNLDDLSSSANNINNCSYVNQDPNLVIYPYTGNSVFSNSGIHLGAQLGVLLNPNVGLALGGKYIAMADYTADVAYGDPTGATENETLSPALVPITLDLYLFLPDSGGRFFINGGLGYYAAAVHVDETYSYSNFYNQNESSQPENWTGDLYSGNIGFQVGIGREFAIDPKFGIAIYASGRYAKITNFRGTVSDQYGNSANMELATGTTNGVVDIDDPAFVNGAYSERPTTLDFTGFDVGLAFNFYSF